MPGRAQVKQALARTMVALLGPSQLNHLVRFEPVLQLMQDGAGGHVLDVGSGSAGLAQLLGSEWRITALDVRFQEQGGNRANENRIVGDVRRLPIADGAFDVVVAVDLLEHLHSDDRRQAVRELCRVGRRHVVIACPTGDAALEGDRRLAARLQSGGRPCPEWLAEHLDRGFPEEGDIIAAAQDFGRLRAWGNESISSHDRLIRAELSPLTAVPTRLMCLALTLALRSSRVGPRHLAAGMLRRLRGMDRSPTYRTIVSLNRRREDPDCDNGEKASRPS